MGLFYLVGGLLTTSAILATAYLNEDFLDSFSTLLLVFVLIDRDV